MAIFRPVAARSPQKPPGQAWTNKVLANSADDPDDADKPDDLDESDNYECTHTCAHLRCPSASKN